MKRIKNALLASIIASGTASGAATAHAQKAPANAKGAASPLAQVRHTNDRIDKLLKSKRNADDPGAKAEMRAIVSGFLDYDELARRALARHWDALTAAQRTDFVHTLHQMIEKSYEKRLKTDLAYTVVYNTEAVKGDDATVSTMVKLKTKGKSTETAIDYKLKRQGDHWVVYDVVTDEVSMAKTYREQFDKIISQESFDGLLKKMRKRIQESDNGDSKKTGAG